MLNRLTFPQLFTQFVKVAKNLSICLTRLAFAVIIGICLNFFMIPSLLLTTEQQSVLASSLVEPLGEILTGTVVITHTGNTTHQMHVFADGRITDQYLNENGLNQIGNVSGATTIAVMFDQHPSNNIDVGTQEEFIPTIPITLNTTSGIPGYNEDSYAEYTSQTLPYRIAQRTLATTTHNCVVMELIIKNNNPSSHLTGGKLLYRVDINVAEAPIGDEGFYDPTRRLVYAIDENGPGYAMGISLLQGDLQGYGVQGDDYATEDDDIRAEMNSPTNAITNGSNNVVWLVANIPDLNPNQAATLAFGLCARTGANQAAAQAAMLNSFDQLTRLSVSKTATPTGGSVIFAGEPLTYNIILSNMGYYQVSNIVITDTIPVFTSLVSRSISQGSIVDYNGLITATIERLKPTSDTVVTLVVTPSTRITSGTIITNQAFIKSEPVVVVTNPITHEIINRPSLAISKTDEHDTVEPGELLAYTLVVSNLGFQPATGIVISDTIPANTTFISSDGGTYDPSTRTVIWPTFNLLGEENQSRYVLVRVNNPLSANVHVLTNTATVSDDGSNGPDLNPDDNIASDVDNVDAAPNLAIIKTDRQDTIRPGDLLTYLLTISNIGNQGATGVFVTDTLPIHTSFILASNEGIMTNGQITWPTFSLAAGVSTTRSVTVRVDRLLPTGVEAITNSAIVTDDTTNGLDPNPNNNLTSDTDLVNAAPNLAIVKSDGQTVINPGGVLTYTLIISNTGDQEATGVEVTDTLPHNTSFISASSGGTGLGDEVTWPSFNLSAGTHTTRTLIVQIHDPLPVSVATITNFATVTDDGANGPDPDLIDNNDEDTDVVNFAPNLALNKDNGVSSAIPGDILTYTLVISNVGNWQATGIAVTDTLPTHTSFISASNRGVQINGLVIWPPFDLTAQAHTIRTVTVRVNNPLPTGVEVITNVATVVNDGSNGIDPNLSNNSDTDVDSINATPDLIITKDDFITSTTPGSVLTYWLTIQNNGNQGATGVRVTDIIPANTTFIDASDEGCYNEGVTTWPAFNLPAGESTIRSVTLQVNNPLRVGVNNITNTATVSDDGSNGSDLTDNNIAKDIDQVNNPQPLQKFYLPVIFKDFVIAPDLIVQTIDPSKNQVVIKNIGNAPVATKFYIDVYINPNPPPTHVNQTWEALATYGLVWRVTDQALPQLIPGGILILSIGDNYQAGGNVTSFASNMLIYVQVDSYHPNTTYGGVLESHEITSASYNNIRSTLNAVEPGEIQPININPSINDGQRPKP